jgi:hypothetical protein
MEALLSDQDLDQFIWNCIEKSTNADDFLAYLNHTNCTYAEQEAAYDKMVAYWCKKDSPKLFDNVIATVSWRHVCSWYGGRRKYHYRSALASKSSRARQQHCP